MLLFYLPQFSWWGTITKVWGLLFTLNIILEQQCYTTLIFILFSLTTVALKIPEFQHIKHWHLKHKSLLYYYWQCNSKYSEILFFPSVIFSWDNMKYELSWHVSRTVQVLESVISEREFLQNRYVDGKPTGAD